MNAAALKQEIREYLKREERPPKATGTHRISVTRSDGALLVREVGTVWRSGVWVVDRAWGSGLYRLVHGPTGLGLASFVKWRIARVAVRALGSDVPSFGALLGWCDQEGFAQVLATDPAPRQIAQWASAWERDPWSDFADRVDLPGRPWATVPGPVPTFGAVAARLAAGASPEALADEIRAAMAVRIPR